MKTLIKIGALEVPSEQWKAPDDRTFRDAWTITTPNSGVVEVDMDKAKDIFREKLREARKPVMEALDVAFMKALETGGDTSAITAKKKELRDATDHPDIAAASTPEQLKALSIHGLEI